MAEAGMAAYGAAIGVAVMLAVICFALRGKGHPEPTEEKSVSAETVSVQPEYKIINLETKINSSDSHKLIQNDIRSSHDLLRVGGTKEGRDGISEKTAIFYKQILTWVNYSDLIRINGIDQECAHLLEESGVDTVVELSKRIPENLHKKLVEVNSEKKIVNYSISLQNVQNWKEQASDLPRGIEY